MNLILSGKYFNLTLSFLKYINNEIKNLALYHRLIGYEQINFIFSSIAINKKAMKL